MYRLEAHPSSTVSDVTHNEQKGTCSALSLHFKLIIFRVQQTYLIIYNEDIRAKLSLEQAMEVHRIVRG
jgi:hypothetical protein